MNASSTGPLTAGLLVSCLLIAPSARAQSLETFVMTVAGQSTGGPSCWTFGAPAPVMNAFGPYGAGLPIGGLAACQIAGDLRSATSSTGPLADSMGLSTSWNGGDEVFDGTTAVQASYGALEADAHAAFLWGPMGSCSLTVIGAESFGLSDDTLTITSPSIANGQSGTLRILVTITGGLSTGTAGTADVELIYRVDAGPTYTMFRAQSNSASQVPFVTSATGNGLSGFTLAPGSMSGSGEIDTLAIPITFGSSFDLRLGMMAYVIPSCIDTTVDADFQAQITGLVLLGPTGQPLTDFAVASASGTAYGASGILAFVNYCTAGVSASGCAAQLSASGTPSATAPSGFTLSAANVEGAKDGLFYYGWSGRQANPWGNGTSYQCVVPPVKRAGVLAGVGTNGACNGSFSQDVNAFWSTHPSKSPAAGAVTQAQLWYRDPASTSNQSTSLSDALEVVVQP
jgi:hypothetical protein